MTLVNEPLQISDEATKRYYALLLGGGYITEQELAHAHAASQKSNLYIGEILISLGYLTPQQVAEVSAFYWKVDPIDLQAEETENDFIKSFSGGQRLLNEAWMPVRHLEDGRLLVVSLLLSPERQQEIAEDLSLSPEQIKFSTTTSWDLRRTLMRIYAQEIAKDASMALYETAPARSAKVVLTKRQKAGFWIGLAGAAIFTVIFPLPAVAILLAAMSVIFFASIVYKYYICILGSQYDMVEKISNKEVSELDEDTLPVYTILVPVFKEENIVAQLVGNLGAIDYPKNKLEVLILTEEEDNLTREAIARANPPENFHVIVVPKGKPQTKPRACNVGLYMSQGEFVVIYDAEDKPEPDQLKKAVIAFRRGEQKMAVVQAALNYFNDGENFLTRMFTLEYSYWFDYMLPGLEAAGMPIPLGGTSNHFRTDALKILGGWDPWNVTEDADLGIRASALGYTVGTINSTTMEEANNSIPNFINQRSRWIKGYLQTTLVHLREPVKLVRATGLKQALGFLFLIGGTPATFLCVIPLYVVSAFIFIFDNGLLNTFIPEWVLVLCLLNLFAGNLLMVHISMLGPFKRHRYHLVTWALLNPVYWLLHSIASYKALWQLIVNPHYWEKTKHGLTTHNSEEVANV